MARLIAGSPRELSTVGIVSGLSATYGTVLLGASNILSVYGQHRQGAPGLLLNVVASVFIGIALFVSAIVISNGVDTVIAGRQTQLRLLRLIGADSAQLRRGLMTAVAQVSSIGAAAGIAVGLVGTYLVRVLLVARDTLPAGGYAIAPAGVIVVGILMVLTATTAAYAGTRKTLESAAVAAAPRPRTGAVRKLVTIALLVLGTLLLIAACLLGERASMAGFVIAFLGTATSSLGILSGARWILPGIVAADGRVLGTGASATVARKNAISDPLRTTRSLLSILIGVTLVTTIAAGMSALTRSVHTWDLSPAQAADTSRTLSAMSAILIALVAISGVIATVGFVSTMSLTVIARTREIGVLRALGFTARQVRSMIIAESMALSGAAVAFGLVLGVLFGAVGAQSLIGSMSPGVTVGLPWGVIACIAAATVLVVIVASIPPSRRAVAIDPVAALAEA